MLRPEMNLPERSEFSSQALLLIRFQILYFSQIPEWNKDPASRISVPFYPGNSEYFLVFLNSGSFRQIRIVNYYENVKKVLIERDGDTGCGIPYFRKLAWYKSVKLAISDKPVV